MSILTSELRSLLGDRPARASQLVTEPLASDLPSICFESPCGVHQNFIGLEVTHWRPVR